MEALLAEEIRQEGVTADVSQTTPVVLTDGVPATRFELTIEYAGADYEGTYSTIWIVAALDGLTVAAEGTILAEDDDVRHDVEAALGSLEVFLP